MTNPSSGPSLLQARGSEPHTHSLVHRHRHDSTHYHRHSRRRQSPTSIDTQAGAELADAGTAAGIEEPSVADVKLKPLDDVRPSRSFVDADIKSLQSLFRRSSAQDASSDHIDSAFPAPLPPRAIPTPDSMSPGPGPGKPVMTSSAKSQATAATPTAALDYSSSLASSLPTDPSSVMSTMGASPTAPPTSASLTSSFDSAAVNSTSSLQASDLTTAPSSSSSIYPTIGDLRSGTDVIMNGNSSFVPASSASKVPANQSLSLKSSTSSIPSSLNSSWHQLSALSSPTIISFTTSTNEQTLSTEYATISEPDSSSVTEPSDSAFPWPDVTSTPTDGVFGATPAPFPGGARPSLSSGSNSNTGGLPPLEPQKVRIIGGVCGSVAGVAFLAVLVLLALRYKKRRDAGALPGRGRLGSTASGTLTGGDSMVMAERSGPSAVFSFSNFARKRDSRQPADAVEEGGQRCFYRVAGRKLPSVLINGGDGYTDPRESVMSGGSDYHRSSQPFDVTVAGSRQLVLGAPMRPVSGVPIMRAGPARTPVTENPFVDPSSPATQDTANNNPESRASASRFHERI